MTGAGLMDPAIADGVVGPSDPPHPTPTQPVYAAINGTPANVVSVFQAPGKIAGIVQVKIQIPAEVNDKPVQVAVGKAQLLIPFNRRLRVHIGSDFQAKQSVWNRHGKGRSGDLSPGAQRNWGSDSTDQHFGDE